jgi:hypothetical protein
MAFGLAGKARATSLGMARLPLALIKHPIAGETLPVIHSRADDVFQELLAKLQATHMAAPAAAEA